MPGFDFSNYNRNVALHAKGYPLPKATSTGTTIVGCIYDKGVVVSCRDPLAPGLYERVLTCCYSDRGRYSSDERADSSR